MSSRPFVVPAASIAVLGLCVLHDPIQTHAADAANRIPIFAYDPTWPKMPLPNDWVLGNVGGVGVDSHDHIWILQRPYSIAHDWEDGLEHNPPTGLCCRMAPPIIEFDQAGNVGASWGGPGSDYSWPEHSVPNMHAPHDRMADWSGEHGVYVDYEDHLWVTQNAAVGSDAHLLKFDRTGRHLLTVGKIGHGEGSGDITALGKPAGVFVDRPTNELYVADGYKNRRIIVFDATSGAYKRHWGAYGRLPNDAVKLFPCTIDGPPPDQFNTPHAVRVSRDRLVYVADRGNCRIQVFKTDGTFVSEVFIGRQAAGGSAFDVDFSTDKDQQFLYMLDGRNKKIWILRRADLAVLSSFGCGGHFGGCFYVPHQMAVDRKGNIYVAEVQEGKRVQRFLYKGLGVKQ